MRRNRLVQEIRRRRDFVLLDPRGVGYSEPSFCPYEARVLATVRLRDLTREEELEVMAAAASRCREGMTALGTDLSAYNSVAMARDLDDVRQDLGYPVWNFLAVSYGTRIALTALREAPDGIRAAILDGPVPPNLNWWSAQVAGFGRALGLVFQRCAADADCNRRFPDLEQTLWSTLERLEREPLVLAMPERADLPEGHLVIDDEMLRSGIHAALYQERLIGLLPLSIGAVAAGDQVAVRELAGQRLEELERFDGALTHAVLCYEEFPFVRPDLVQQAETRYPQLVGWIALDGRRAICEALQPHRAGPEANAPVRSDVPALLITGELDPVTPPSNGRLAAETLGRATLLEIPQRSHVNSGADECTRGIVLAFLEQPLAPLQTDCVGDQPPLTFVTEAPG